MWLRWLGSALLLGSLVAIAVGLAYWKREAVLGAEAAAAAMPEPAESVTVATVAEREHRRTTTSVGTGENAIPNRLKRGEIADLVIVADALMQQLIDEGLVLRDSRTPVARSTVSRAAPG